jgi:hypothetical protein
MFVKKLKRRTKYFDLPIKRSKWTKLDLFSLFRLNEKSRR